MSSVLVKSTSAFALLVDASVKATVRAQSITSASQPPKQTPTRSAFKCTRKSVSVIFSRRGKLQLNKNNNNEKNGNNTYKYSGLIGDLKRSKVIKSGNKNRQESDLCNDCYDIESWLIYRNWNLTNLEMFHTLPFQTACSVMSSISDSERNEKQQG